MTTLLRCTRRTLLLAVLAMITAGCASPPQRTPLPAELTLRAEIPGVPQARFWGDEWPRWSAEQLDTITTPELRERYSAIYETAHSYLAISGGGANGAFGAGLLVGWTATGDRPRFTMVTGVSTGALAAPFAFLGPEYDDKLRLLYTKTQTSDLVEERNIIAAAFSDAMADTTRLRKLIEREINASVIDAIALEYRTGRRLFIGTVNLDAGRSVIWNIGAIANSDYPRKVGLIHDVLQASAAIPVAFPPVVIPVTAAGQTYDEMHVDGGTASQVFVYPAAIDWPRITKLLRVQGQPRVYVIRNAFLEPDHQGIQRSLLPIATRSIDSLIRTQGIGDLYQIHALCVRDGNEFNLAYIPSDFEEEPGEGFDPVYMGKLFELGHRMARDGYPWKNAPPGFSRGAGS